MGPIPAWLGNLTQLKVLHLGGNRLSGPIPAKLGNLTQLEVLHLGGNRLSGPIPAELGNLTQLEVLHLGGNRLSGPVPVELGQLTELRSLRLSSNQLDGSIPAALGNLTNLELLNLENNALSGSIPDVLWKLTDLEELDLGGNALSGAIPVELGALARIEGLDLSSNRLSGPFPAVLRLPNVLRLDLRGNQWSGPLPGDAARLANLEVLHSSRGRLRDAVEVGIERFASEAGQLVALTARSHGFDAPAAGGQDVIDGRAAVPARTWRVRRFTLLSPAGERLALTDVDNEFHLAWLPSDGEYRIEVVPRRGLRDYQVDVRAVPVEPLSVGSPGEPFLTAGVGVRAWRFRGTAGHVVSVDARVWIYGRDAEVPSLNLLSSDGKRLGSESNDHYYKWRLTAVLPRTEDYVSVYAYTNKYSTVPVRMVVRASAPE